MSVLRPFAAIAGVALVVVWVVSLLLNHQVLQTTLLGANTGALIAAVAIAVVLTYRGAGVVNFSVAAMAMYASFIYYDLWQNGAIFFPPPIGSLTLVSPPKAAALAGAAPAMGIWWAFAGTMVLCAVLGMLFHLLIFRPLRNAPPLAKLAASIGLYLVLYSTITVRFPNSSGYSFPGTLLPNPNWTIDGVIIPGNQAVLVLIVIGVAAVLWAVFRFTKFGMATRAAAENERGAIILGYNPNSLAAVNWVVSTMLAGAFGVLLSSIQTGISPEFLSLLIVPALAAALVGGFRSFPIVVIASLVFGASQSWITAVGSQSWFPSWLTTQGSPLQGLADLVPLLVIVVVLFSRGERLPSRGDDTALRMPKATQPRHTVLPVVGIFVLAVVAAFLLDSSWRGALELSLIAAVLCSSLTVLAGFMGQVSLMQMTIGGVAAFVLSKFCDVHGIGFPWGPLIAAGGGTLIGLLAAIPSLRIRGVNLAVATLAAAVAIENFVYYLPLFSTTFTQASQATIGPPSLLGHGFGPQSLSGWNPDPWFSVFCAIVLVMVLWTVIAIRRSRLGRRMLAVRSNERAAAAVGVNVARTKLVAFAISAFIAGIGGTLYGYLVGGVDVTTFSSTDSLILIAVAYLGGIAAWEGAPISGLIFQGGIFATLLSNIFHVNPEYAIYIAGLGLIVASINNQEGITGTVREGVAALRRRSIARQATPPVVQAGTSGSTS